MKSLVLIVPASHKATADGVSIAFGHAGQGAETYTVPLSNDGVTTSHYGCHTWATPAFVETVYACKNSQVFPSEAIPDGKTEVDVSAMCGALIVSVKDDGDHHDHFDNVCAASGLVRI